MPEFRKIIGKRRVDKRGQVSLFVIVAVIIVAAVVLFFALRGRFGIGGVPAEFLPVYNYYSECVQQEAERGIGLLGLQGGRIDIESYQPGSDYAPFSSHLNFFGSPVEYWYYVSGNGLIRENSVTKGEMESELEEYLSLRIADCNFDEFYQQGFYVELPEEAAVDVTIQDNSVDIDVLSEVVVYREESSARKTRHEIEVSSKLGKLYNEARKVYDKEIEESFLEDYGVDVMRLYAPVDGVDVSCSPAIWNTEDVVEGIKDGLTANFESIKFKGDYYSLDDKEDDYFVVDENVNEPVRFFYSKEWPSKIEIYGDKVDEVLMIAEPVGNQEGLGVMGFCYAPYHFVYDIAVPVMVQVGDGLEIFQFPVVMLIDNNQPKEVNLLSVDYGTTEFDICDFREGSAEIYTFDTNLNPVEADISFECLDQRCNIGRTQIGGQDSVLRTEVPQCVNGNLVARAEGFAEGEVVFSSNEEFVKDIILEREYENEVSVKIDGAEAERAIVYFIADDGTDTAVLPENNKVALKEGSYEIQVYVYGDTGISIPASKRTQCVDVSRSGIQGLFGATRQECFTIDYPETKIETALRGGGKAETYVLASELETGRITLEIQSLPSPDSLEQLQLNYEIFENLGVGVVFG
ncbi:hypothetical protein GW924_04490 [Candidatus Pacearchaeota archaeon]|nr:hypothetical protein [Candidatus Pacearchaeota archaeon]